MRWFPRSRALQVVTLGAVIAVIAGAVVALAPGLLRGPEVATGDLPSGYDIGPLAVEGAPADLDATGMARVAGRVAEDAETVVLSANGESVDAVIDDSVDPPVWNALVVPPEGEQLTLTITATNGYGRSTTTTEAISADYPKMTTDVIVHPNTLVLSADGPTLDAFDPSTGQAVVSGVSKGEVRPQSVLVAGITGEVAPYGVLRRVTSVAWDGDTATVQTVQASLDNALLQADITDPPEVIGGRRSKSGPDKPQSDFREAVAQGIDDPGDLPDEGAPDVLIDAINGDEMFSDGGATVEFGLLASVGVGIDIKLDFEFRGIFAPPVALERFATGIELEGGVAARLKTDSAIVDPAVVAPSNAQALDPVSFSEKGSAKKNSFKKSGDLFSHTFPTWQFMAGPVPVVIVPKMVVTGEVSGKVTPEATAAFAAVFGLDAGITVRGDDEPKVYAEPHGEAGSKISLALSGQASLKLDVTVKALAYDALGPTFTLGAGIDGTLTLVAIKEDHADWGPGIEASIDVPVHVSVGVEGKIPMVDVGVEYSTDLYSDSIAQKDFEWYPFRVDPAPAAPPPPSADPNAPLAELAYGDRAAAYKLIKTFATPGECLSYDVFGFDNASSGIDVSETYGSECGGDPSATFYRVRNGAVSSSEQTCFDCFDAFDPGPYNELLAAYSNRSPVSWTVYPLVPEDRFDVSGYLDSLQLEFPGANATAVGNDIGADTLVFEVYSGADVIGLATFFYSTSDSGYRAVAFDPIPGACAAVSQWTAGWDASSIGC